MTDSRRFWRMREHRISYDDMRKWLPNYRKVFDRARMKLSSDIAQPRNPKDRFYDIEVSDKRLDDRAAKRNALTLEGWQFAGTQQDEFYQRSKSLIQEKFGEHMTIPAVCAILGEPREGYVEVFARKEALEKVLGDIVDDLNIRRIGRRAAKMIETVQRTDEDMAPPPPEIPPSGPHLRLV